MTTTPPPGRKSGGKIALLFGGAGVIFVLLLCVCSASGYGFYRYHNRLTGKWKETGGPAIIEFKSDGTFTIEIEGLGGLGNASGTYTTSGSKITMTSKSFGGTSESETGEYAVSGSELTLTKTDGGNTVSTKFTRQ